MYVDAHVNVALLYEKLGRRARAREHWRRYLQIDPQGPWADVARRHLSGGGS
jgi:Tfp pilus assembly protein PilF